MTVSWDRLLDEIKTIVVLWIKRTARTQLYKFKYTTHSLEMKMAQRDRMLLTDKIM